MSDKWCVFLDPNIFCIVKWEKTSKVKLHQSMLDVLPTLEYNKRFWHFLLFTFFIFIFLSPPTLFSFGIDIHFWRHLKYLDMGQQLQNVSTLLQCSSFPSSWILDHSERRQCPISGLSCQNRTGQTHKA